ncbi:Protein deadpan [Araneus ventricosus]|uniref:Protein deadpan n=1 Tax=Araneus ventricosus TaxID=182803 RepID=A0A4Y2ELK6_ARAVE|nr:Protein deadpan [Araneus ventricosus]
MPTKRSQEFMDLKNGSDKKASKPLIEKRRRARINHSLAQLKTLVIDSKTESARQTKLEKADILEMTVQHLKEIKKQQIAVPSLDNRHTKKKYEIGYLECARQVELFLSNLMDPKLTEVEVNLKRRLKDHLCKSFQGFSSTDENIHVDKCKETFSASYLSNGLSSVIKNEQNNVFQKKCEDTTFCEEDAQNSAVQKTHYSSKTKYDYYELDQMNVNEARNSHFENSHFSGNFKENPHQSLLQPKTLKHHHSPFPEQEVFSKARFNPSPNSLDRYQSSPSSSSSNSHSYAQEWVNIKDKCSNDMSHHKTSQFCSTNFQENFNVQKELHQSTSNVKSDRYDNNYHQIPLVPRRLSNGEWALVLPGNFTLTENEAHSPLSAFKLVWPTSSCEIDSEQQAVGQRASGSPLSSSVSDLSSEDYSCRMDVEAPVKVEHDGQTDFGFVWRPW